jgi:hypothetical protein
MFHIWLSTWSSWTSRHITRGNLTYGVILIAIMKSIVPKVHWWYWHLTYWTGHYAFAIQQHISLILTWLYFITSLAFRLIIILFSDIWQICMRGIERQSIQSIRLSGLCWRYLSQITWWSKPFCCSVPCHYTLIGGNWTIIYWFILPTNLFKLVFRKNTPQHIKGVAKSKLATR